MNQPDSGFSSTPQNPSCGTCLGRPCEQLRHGGASPGSVVFVHARRVGPGFDTSCPYAAPTFDEVEILLSMAQSSAIDDQLGDVLGDLTPSERMQFDHRLYIASFGDTARKISFLRILFDAGIIRVARIPLIDTGAAGVARMTFDEDAPRGQSASSKKSNTSSRQEEPDDVTPTVAPAPAAAPAPATAAVTITNPRWEHTDENRKKDSPDTATVADKIMLRADVKGLDNGTAVTFEVFDTSVSPPKRYDTVDGTIQASVGSAEWVTSLPEGVDLQKIKIGFGALVAGGKRSPVKDVKIVVKEFEFSY